MAEFVDGRLPVPAPPPPQRPNDLSSTDTRSQRLDLGPLVGAQRGFHTREKSPLNGGMNGVEMIPDQFTGPSDQHATVDTTELSEKDNDLRLDHFDGSFPKVQTISASTSASPSPPPPVTSIQVEEDRSQEVSEPITPDLSPSHPRRLFPDAAGSSAYRSASPSDSDPQPQSEDEEQMPPKMRKRWIHRSMEGLSVLSPSLSPCGSNISLGSVLDEGQMEVDLVSSGSYVLLSKNAVPTNYLSQIRRICRHHLCPPISTQQRSHHIYLPVLRVFLPANCRHYRLCLAPRRQNLQRRHRLLRHSLIYRYYRRRLLILPTRLRFLLNYPL